MKWRYIFRTFAVISAITDWFAKATVDGEIDGREGGDLIAKLAKILNIKVKVK